MSDKFWDAVEEAIDIGNLAGDEEVKPESSLTDDLMMDSIELVELVMALEEEFDILISDEAAEKWETAGDVAEYLRARA